MLRVSIPFMLGMSEPLHRMMEGRSAEMLFYACLVLLCLGQLLARSAFHRFRAGFGIPTIILPLATGACCLQWVQEGIPQPDQGPVQSRLYRLQVLDQRGVSTSGTSLLTRLERLVEEQWQPVPGDCVLFVAGWSERPTPRPGTTWYAVMRCEPMEPPRNPGEIDFKGIYASKGIYYSGYLPVTLLVPSTSPGNRNLLALTLIKQRNQLLRIVRHYVRNPEALGMAEAMFIGYREDLSEELSQRYARTGVMHVIAISGLHLSLIFTLFLLLFRVLPGRAGKPWLVLLMAIPAIWWFSLLTGASASVMRSAVMCTLPVLSALGHRRYLGLNGLLATAMLLLAWNPLWLTDAGFQLSYAAIAGIQAYQRQVFGWIVFRHPLLRGIWELVSVTLAAQVFTTPLVIYYFHQFPVYFLLTNLIAVPLSSLILLCTIATCLLSPLPRLAEIGGWITETLIGWMNRGVSHMDQMPFGMLENLYLNGSATVLLLLLLLLALGWGPSRRSPVSSMLPPLLLAWIALVWMQAAAAAARQTLVIAQAKGQTALIQCDGLRSRQFIVAGSGMPGKRLSFLLGRIRQHYRSRQVETTMLTPESVHRVFTGKKLVLIVGKDPVPGGNNGGRRPDLIVLTQNADTELVKWYEATGCKTFVADGSNGLWKIQEWQKEAEKLPLRLHSTPRQGAFLLD